ncbi:MAG: hypothetical protein P4L33_10555 [Capsulimonadaceae bacterium]|nr:hypothetical protein [Capsulimonadaceae bacterium]
MICETMFDVEKIGIIDEPPVIGSDRRVRAWDMGGSGRADYTAGVLMAEIKPRMSTNVFFIVLDVALFRSTFEALTDRVRRIADEDGKDVLIALKKPQCGFACDAVMQVRQAVRGYRVAEWRNPGPPTARASAFAKVVNSRRVALARGAWNDSLIEEMRLFPLCVYDNQVQAASDAFLELAHPSAPLSRGD